MQNLFAKIAGVVVALALVLSAAAPASALTASEITALLVGAGIDAQTAATLAAVLGTSGSSSSSSSCTSYTRDLTLGSTGADVVALQSMLEMGGYLTIPVGVSKGYFGAMTQSALASWQAANGVSPASGYFGPITRSAVKCDSGSTGTGSTGSSNSGLSGGAGSIQDTETLSGYSNEEVGEDEEDVEVAGIEIEAGEESDIELLAVKLDFDKTSSGAGSDDDFDDYASEVSIWFDGEEVARLDADEFDDDNNYSRTVTLDGGAVIDADEMGELVVAVSGVSNLDSNNAGETWTVDFVSVRFGDAQGAVITDTLVYTPETFTFESFSSSADIEFKIQSGDDSINDARVLVVDDNDKTDNIELFSFKVKIDGDSDVELKDLPITSTHTGTANTLDDIFAELRLEMDGDEIGSENPTASTTVVFDNIDVVLEPGTYDFVLVGEAKATSSATYAVGDTILFTFGETQTDWSDTGLFDAEDENGDNLLDADKTGTEASEAHTFLVDGIRAKFIESDATAFTIDGDDNDRAELELVFDVTNFGEDTLYIPNVATFTVASTSELRTAPSTSQGIGYAIQHSNATTTILAANVSHTLTSTADSESSSFSINPDDTERFTLRVIVKNTPGTGIDNVSVRALLAGIGWADSNSATSDSVYTVDLIDAETGYAVVAN